MVLDSEVRQRWLDQCTPSSFIPAASLQREREILDWKKMTSLVLTLPFCRLF
jgi:hypothetical protein